MYVRVDSGSTVGSCERGRARAERGVVLGERADAGVRVRVRGRVRGRVRVLCVRVLGARVLRVCAGELRRVGLAHEVDGAGVRVPVDLEVVVVVVGYEGGAVCAVGRDPVPDALEERPHACRAFLVNMFTGQ